MLCRVGELRTSRVLYVDWARGFAIGLALFSHLMLAQNSWESLADESPVLYALRVLTRAATPTFILLFGVSLEFAYVRRWASSPKVVRRRLLQRALKCYGALVLLAAAAWLGGLISFPQAVLGAGLVEPVPNANIFLFYAAGMVFALGLVPLRIAIGILPTLAITLAWWPIAALLNTLIDVPPALGAVTSRIIGIGDGGGPSVLHALPLVVVGMAIGQLIRSPKDRSARIAAGVALAAIFAGDIAAVFQDGPFGAVRNYTAHYREVNSFAYFAIGATLAILILLAARTLEHRTRLLSRRKPGPFGGHSLQAFLLGNVGVNLIGTKLQPDSPYLGILIAALYVAVFWLIMKLWRTWRDPRLQARADRDREQVTQA